MLVKLTLADICLTDHQLELSIKSKINIGCLNVNTNDVGDKCNGNKLRDSLKRSLTQKTIFRIEK